MGIHCQDKNISKYVMLLAASIYQIKMSETLCYPNSGDILSLFTLPKRQCVAQTGSAIWHITSTKIS